MAHRIELNQLGLGGIALTAAVVGGSMFFAPGAVTVGPAIGVGHNTYSAYVRCKGDKKTEPSMLKSFVGVQDGKRVLVRGVTRSAARSTLGANYSGCKISSLNREGRKKRFF